MNPEDIQYLTSRSACSALPLWGLQVANVSRRDPTDQPRTTRSESQTLKPENRADILSRWSPPPEFTRLAGSIPITERRD